MSLFLVSICRYCASNPEKYNYKFVFGMLKYDYNKLFCKKCVKLWK